MVKCAGCKQAKEANNNGKILHKRIIFNAKI